MSFFTLRKADLSIRTADELADYFHHAGIKRVSTEQLKGYELTIFSDLAGNAPERYVGNNGDFIVQFGSLIYRKMVGHKALQSVLESFDQETFDWADMLGSYTLLIYKSGDFYVVNDGLGTAKLYFDDAEHVISNSFLACCLSTPISHLNTAACYEYVINGALFGTDTLVEGVNSYPANTIIRASAGTIHSIVKPSPIQQIDEVAALSLDEAATLHCQQLRNVFEPIAHGYADRLRVSFSGGFDSRLMLAMLLEQDIKPALFVYGSDHDADVLIARHVAKAEGLELVHVNKAITPIPNLDEFEAISRRNLIAFDGWKVEYGLLDHGEDVTDRLSRHDQSAVPLNGSLGEIYRNFHYIPDGRSSTGAVTSTFYSQYDTRAFSAQFSEKDYRQRFSNNMLAALHSEHERLERYQVEELYPLFRGRFWTGRDTQLNQRFGTMFFPYMEPKAIDNTAKVAIKHKDLGYLQGKMIAQTNPRLASYPSDYGFPFDGPRPLAYRAKTWLGTQRPAWLRKQSFKLTNRNPFDKDGVFSEAYLQQVIDPTFPRVGSLFELASVYSPKQFGLIATLEFLATELDLSVKLKL